MKKAPQSDQEITDRHRALFQKMQSIIDSFRKERETLVKRLAELDAILLSGAKQAQELASPDPVQPRRRQRNAKPLVQAVREITAGRPMTKTEILAELKERGYHFSGAKPLKTLETVLYSSKNGFRRQNGRFSGG